jgi:hypothetical protein
MAVVILVTLRAGGIERVDVPYQTDHGVSLTTAGGIGPYIVFYAVLALIFVLSLTAGRRGFCHHACWMAPFMMIGRGIRNALRLPAVQLRSNTPACVGCRACTTSPDEPRGLRDGPERANGEQRMHPVRYLRRYLPPQGHSLRLRQTSSREPGPDRETVTAP